MYKIAKVSNQGTTIKEVKTLQDVDIGKNVTWVHLTTRNESDLEEIRKKFGFHPLALEDCVNRQERSKVEIYDRYVFILFKDPDLKGSLIIDHLALFVGEKFLVTVSSKEVDEISDIFGWVMAYPKREELTPDFITYRLLDRIVDSYFPLLDKLEGEIEEVEQIILKDPTTKGIPNKIFVIKRMLMSLRKATWPGRDVFSSLAKEETPYFSRENRVYFRDVYDHMILVMDIMDTYRELISSILETYLSAISNSMNHVIKVLTVVSTIFMPLTLIASIYGMNFQGGASSSPLNMPELYSPYGYIFSLILMLVVGVVMYYYLRKKGWF